MKNIIPVLLCVIPTFIFQSCTNKEVAKPLAFTSTSEQNIQAAALLKNPAPGDYTVKLYIENRDTSTAEFKGYIFTFKTNGVLLAKVDTTTYTGKWESKNNGKQLKLDIKGTTALDVVNKGWDVVAMTEVEISLKTNEGKFGNKLVFAKN